MSTAYVAFDTRSGRIISVHHGASDASYARQRAQGYSKIAQDYSKIADEYIAVIAVPSGACEQGKQYKIDIDRKMLVETAAGEQGVGFGFGSTGRVS